MAYDSILTVTTPAADYSLVDLATVKDELDITVATTDARLTRWIRDATAAIQAYTGRVFRQEVVTEAFRSFGRFHVNTAYCHYDRVFQDGPSRGSLRLARYPIASVASVTEDDTLLDPTDFEIDAQAGLVTRLTSNSDMPWQGSRVVVAYTGGYAALADVPADLQAACLLLISARQSSHARGDPLTRRVTIPGVIEREYWQARATDNPAMPDEVVRLIDRYRDVRM